MPQDLNILYVTTALLSPPYAGCMQRTFNIARQLKRCGRVTLLAVSRCFDPDSVALCRAEFERFEQITLRSYSDFPAPWGEIIRKVHMHWPSQCGIRAGRSDQVRFETWVNQHDLVWFHTLGAQTPFLLTPPKNAVIDLDDLNHCKYELSSHHQPTLRFRLSAKVQARKWKTLEQKALDKYTAVVVCSDQDKQFLGSSDKIGIVPNGFNPPLVVPQWKSPNSCRLGFIGLLTYGPNRDGLIWFRDKVWPQIRSQKPEMKLRIVGRLPLEKDYVAADGFEYLGYVDDPTEEMQSWSAMIVPIPYGGGTRIKILDAFSKKCPIVSTTIGAHGIQVVHKKNILLADDPGEFARQCLSLSNAPERGKQLAEEGWKLFTEKYTWDEIGKSISVVAKGF
jgi:glycosyltransferase involved in cell wall biosynthesis